MNLLKLGSFVCSWFTCHFGCGG